MKTRWAGPTIIVVLVLVFSHVLRSQAASGLPDSLEFAYGAHLDIDGEQVTAAINAAAAMGVDWIAVDFDWAQRWEDASAPPDLDSLNLAMSLARQGNMSVLMSITNAPGWAATPAGPDPEMTAGLVLSLVRLYPESLLAVELFPAANTYQGWGAPPNAAAYTHMLDRTQAVLNENGSNVVIVAAGLTPLFLESDGTGIDDLVYLEALYQSGAGSLMQIIGVRLPVITGDTMFVPDNGDTRYLRHYEEVRQVMLQNNHQDGLIWLTGFSWPAVEDQPSNAGLSTPEEQASWLDRSYRLIRAQLYIGAGFYSWLNPPSSENNDLGWANTGSLVRSDGSMHPAFDQLSKLIALNNSAKTVVFQGNISKKTPLKLNIKP